MLTNKQQKLLMYIHSQVSKNGVSPSFEEMKEAAGLRSKSGIHQLIKALEERGFIRRLPNRARALEVIKVPEAPVPETQVPEAHANNNESVNELAANDNIEIPIMGKIAAGVPIEAIQNRLDSISVAPSILKTGEHFALEVQGDSMVDEGILEGDIVLIQKNPTATQGDIVVALVNNEEATLKRFKQNQNQITLEPANQSFEAKTYQAEQIKIQGHLVGLVRKY